MKKIIFLMGLVVILFTGTCFGEVSDLRIQELKYNPYPAEAGRYLDLWIKIDNYGLADAKNVICTLLPEYPFFLDPNENETREIGILPAKQQKILQYKLRVASDAVKGWNELKIKCTSGNSGVWVTREMEIYVESKLPSFSIGLVQSEPEKLFPDSQDNKLSIEIQNIGNGDAELVTAKLLLPSGFSPTNSYSNLANLGTISAGESKEAVYYIDIDEDVEPKTYEATLLINYKDANNNRDEYKNQSLPVEIQVKPIPFFEIIEKTLSPEKLSQGDKAELRLKIKNTGSEEAESVSIRIHKQSDQPFEFDEKYDYIGNLKPGETGEAVFRFDVDEDAKLKTYLLRAEIRYLLDDEVRLVEKQIPVRVEAEKKDSKLLLLTLLIFLILIGAGIYGWKKFRKR